MTSASRAGAAARGILAAGLAVALLSPAAAGASRDDRRTQRAPMLRAVELPGLERRDDPTPGLERLARAGFDAYWVHAGQLYDAPLGRSPQRRDPLAPLLSWARRHELRGFLSLNPALAGDGTLALCDAELVRRVVHLARRWSKAGGGRDLVLSFEGAPAENTELRDLLAYGVAATPAHLDLVHRVATALPRRMRLWYHAADATTTALLDSQADRLPESVGFVWTGSRPLSPTVEIDELDRLLARARGRPVVLRDAYPANQYGPRMPLSCNLGALRGRDPALVSRLTAHLSVPMESWEASSPTLATVVDWARSPSRYDPDASLQRALAALAGDDGAALDALRTQALEWGGPPGDRNWRTAERDNPTRAAEVLRDPARLVRWRWTLARYPERMQALRGLRDEGFRDALLETMARRLAIARALPAAREILARQAAGRSDVGALVEELDRLRRSTAPPSARVALDRFLVAAGLQPLLRPDEGEPE